MFKSAIKWLVLSLCLIVIDQITKVYFANRLSLGESIPLLSFFDFTLVHNYGASFGMLSNAGGWQRWFFSAVALIACIIFLVWLIRLPKGQPWLALGLTCLLAGALGNLIDRLYLGYVIDFLHFFWGNRSFPVFNIADCCVSFGVFCLIVDMLFYEPKRQKSIA